MNSEIFSFKKEQFNKLFPFYISLDKEDIITSYGESISKIIDIKTGINFFELFRFKRPTIEGNVINFKSIKNQVIILECIHESTLMLRGQFEELEKDTSLLFVGSPWFGTMDSVVKKHLSIHDFALHDPMIDLLHVLKTQEIINEEVKELLQKVNSQKNILKNDQIELKRRENMLEAISQATDELLSNEDFFNAVENALPLLGKAVGVSRIYLFENEINRSKEILTLQRIEWRSIDIEAYKAKSNFQQIKLQKFSDLFERLSNKEPFKAKYNELNENSRLKKVFSTLGIKSILIIPIFFKDHFWGFVGYDDCNTERMWSDVEIASLKSFSASVANALARWEAAKEVYNMALFSLENPDPVIRINLNGDVLLSNNAANKIKYYHINDSIVSANDYFSFLSKTISVSNPILHFEAYDDSKTYMVIARLSENKKHINIHSSEITEQKKAEYRLKESEKRISTLVLNLQTGILLEDETRHIALCNKIFCEMFGISANPESLYGMDCTQSAEMNKSLFKDPEGFVRRIDEILQNKKSALGDQLDLIDGRIFERDYVPIYISNEYKGHLWKYTDITEQKNYERNLRRFEEKYRSIIQNMKLGLIEVNLQDEIQYANQNFCEISGYSSDELINKKAHELLGIKNASNIIEEKNALRKRGVSDSYELNVINKKGKIRWWLISGAPNYNDMGELIGSIGIHLDISEQKELEEELRIAKDKAEESSKAKESFLANMSHEIRTPLNAIIGMIRELAKMDPTPKQTTYLKHAGTASQHLLSIINNILDISKIEAGEFQLDCRTYSLASVIENVKAIMLPSAKDKLLELTTNLPQNLPKALLGDPSRIQQILLNILSNSIKFTEKGSVRLTCEILSNIDSVYNICISIYDTGIGIDPKYQQNLFKKFTQEDLSIARRYGGTGLGMAITYELVQLMNGYIEVESEKGKGTTFKIYLTQKPGNIQEIDKTNPENNLTKRIDGLKVLLVEDNELNRFVAINTLSRLNLLVTEAENGLQAIKLLEGEPFDIILMDLQMPEMDGLEATKIIRTKLNIGTPIIALTANAFKNEIEKCFNVGMNDYVTKPFDENMLIQAIEKNVSVELNLPPKKSIQTDSKQDKLYDFKNLEELSHGDKSFIHKMMKLFCSTAPATVSEIKLAFQRNNYESMRALAHRLKPTIDNLCILTLKTDIRTLEKFDLDQNTIEEAESLIVKLDKTISAISDEFTSILTDLA